MMISPSRISKYLLISFIVITSLLFSQAASPAYKTTKEEKASKSSSQKSTSKKQDKKKTKKHTKEKKGKKVKKFVEYGVSKTPPPIPDDAIQAFANTNLDDAVRILRMESNSPRAVYLLRETQRILSFKKGADIKKTNLHRTYQNLGIAYHNLYLFLKGRDIKNDDFFNEAKSYYKKSRSKSSESFHKTEINLLMASLLAAHGDLEDAKKIHDKIDTGTIESDARLLEYDASYHAARGEVDDAVDALAKAHKLNAAEISAWLSVCDDFTKIQDDPKFKDLLKKLEVEKNATDLKLKLRQEKKQFKLIK